jgi:hypothetical protein
MEDGNWGALLQHFGVCRVKMFVGSSKYSFTGWFLRDTVADSLSWMHEAEWEMRRLVWAKKI